MKKQYAHLFFYKTLFIFLLTGLTGSLNAQAGAALNFDGADDYIDTQADITELGQADFTIEAWIRSTSNDRSIVVYNDADNVWEIGEKSFYLDPGGRPAFVGNTNSYITSSVSVTDGLWHHVAVVWDYSGTGTSGTGKIYIDGIDQTFTSTYWANYNNSTVSGTFKIGARSFAVGEGMNMFQGDMDELRIWNRALCQAEIQYNMNCELPITGIYPGLVGYYRFNHGLHNFLNIGELIATDLSPYGNDGLLTGFALIGVMSNWFAPGAVVSGVPCASVFNPNIVLEGNGVPISNQNLIPSPADHSHFGYIPLGSVLSRTFIIRNTGSTPITISSSSLSGMDAGSFTITSPPVSPVAVSATTSIIVSFSAAAPGLKQATLNILSNDCDQSPFYFGIAAEGAPPASALDLGGPLDYVTLADPKLGLSDCTIEAWFRHNNSSSGGYLITTRSSEAGPAGNWWAVSIGSGTTAGSVHFELAQAGGTYTVINTLPNSFLINTWNHLAVVRSGSLISIYINGELKITAVEPIKRNWTTGYGIMRFGGWPNYNGAWFDGALDEVRIWTVARTQCEIQSNMNNEIHNSAVGLIGNYHFNHGSANLPNTGLTFLEDSSPELNHGTLTSFSLSGTSSNWISPGGVVPGYTTVSVPITAIDVRGNGNSITNGSTLPSTLDFTDFNGVYTRTFTIHNTTGGGTLMIGSPFLTGANAGEFTVTALPSSSIAGIGSADFQISFTPANSGARTAFLNILSNDCTHPLFQFMISASAPPGAALHLDGINDHVTINHLPGFDFSTSMTIEAWIRNASGNTEQTIASKQENSWQFSINGGGTANGRLSFFANGLSPAVWVHGNTNISDDNWHHVAATYNGAEVKLYVDGVLDAIASLSGTMSTGGDKVVVGLRPSINSFFSGSIDELRFWNTERSHCELMTYKDREITGTHAGLVACYHFNEGSAGVNNTGFTILPDLNNPLYDGTLNGFTLTDTTSNWVAPGGVISGYTTAAVPGGTLSVSGNGNSITAGAAVTSTLDYTDFGSTTTRQFQAGNTGLWPLLLDHVSISGGNAASFSLVSSSGYSYIPAGGSSNFMISFIPTSAGVNTAVVNILSSDCSHPNYSFVISAFAPTAEALDFDGVNDYVAINNTSALDNIITGDFTFEAWVNPSVSKMNTILSKGDGSYVPGTGEYIFQLNAFNQVSFFHTAQNVWKYSWNTVPLNAWSHVAVTFDGTHIKFYINGLLDAVETSSATTNTTGNTPVFLGIQGHNCQCNHFQGKLDEIRMWNVARTPCEILSYMKCEIPANATGLLANYHFNQGIPSGLNTSDTLVTDATGINTGTISGMSLSGSNSNWVSPGAVVSGYTTAAVNSASVVIRGNNTVIPPGKTSTSTSDHTDFGVSMTRTFEIQNTGSDTVQLGYSFFSGPSASCFSIAALSPALLAGGAGGSLEVVFTPTAVGSYSAVLHVLSTDCSVPDYSFVVTATGVTGAALSFDGMDDYIDLGPSNVLKPANALTAEAWVYMSSWSSSVTVLGNAFSSGYSVGTDGNDLKGAVFVNGAFLEVTTPLSGISPGWHHVALTYDGQYATLYLDGTFQSVNDATAVYPITYTGNHTILGASAGSGMYPYGGAFNGQLDEVRIWDRALCQAEIAHNMNCEISASGNGLLANYQFNQGVAFADNSHFNMVLDMSGNSLNGNMADMMRRGAVSNWVSPGAVTTGSSCGVFNSPEIDVRSGTISIPLGYATPSSTNQTEFGNISVSAGIVRTFTIHNSGSSPLSVSSISLSGADASSFTTGVLSPPSPVAPGNLAVFSVTFAPVAAGTRSAWVHVVNDDCDESNYTFAIRGNADAAESFIFDGTDDYISCGNFLSASYTKEAWIKINASANGNHFISSGSGSNGSVLWAPGIYNYSLSAGHNGNWNQVQDLSPLTLGTWYHVAVTYDAPSTTMHLYRNGVLVASNTSVPPFTGSAPLELGAFNSGAVINGAMDEVRIWNRALCQSEIQNNMNCEVSAPASGLLASYHFNQGTGYGSNSAVSSVTDASGNSHAGTVMNAALSGTLSNWQTGGAVSTGSACTLLSLPDINLVGNGTDIAAGQTLTALSDHTDFGNVCSNTLSVRAYTIQNTGTDNLLVSGISLSGAQASEFSAGTLNPASPVTPGNYAVFTVTFQPASAGTKTAVVTIANNDCNEDPYTFVISGSGNNLPVVTASVTHSVICDGEATTLQGGGADTYTWSGGTGVISDGVAFSPTTTLTYTVTGTNTLSGCTSTNLAIQTITVNPSPTLAATAGTLILCEGASTTITPSGADSYTLNPGVMTGTQMVVSPAATTDYSLTGTNTWGCAGINTVVLTVSVNPLPVVSASSSDPVICETATTSLLGSGADTYTWTGGAVNGMSFSPSSTTSYTLSGTYTLSGCTSTNLAVQTITVEVLPSVSASAVSSVICEGETATLTATGADTYTWQPGNIQGSPFSPAPTVFTTYTLSGSSLAGCTSTNLAVQSISVNPLPVVSAGISHTAVCEGSTITVSASGADSYAWSQDVINDSPFVPQSSGSYSVQGTSDAGCTSTNVAVVSVTVYALPSLSVQISQPVICQGKSTSLSGSGAASYTWSGGISNQVAFTPSTTSTYTLTGTDANDCVSQTTVTVVVNTLPVLSVQSSSSLSCEADPVTLTASGASSYTWSAGDFSPGIIVTPSITTVYTVSGTDNNSCLSTAHYTQVVQVCPGTFNASAAGKDVSCEGRNDGEIAVVVSTSYTNPVITYKWNPAVLCPDNSCDTLRNLQAGSYQVTVGITYTTSNGLVKTDSLVLGPVILSDISGPCEVKVYTGISANQDGVNDVLTVENIDRFPNNKVIVFNRWGKQVFEMSGYNNQDKVWPRSEDLPGLSSNTYFYLIDLGDGSKPIKGWVELMKD